jgi:hypothetical protein
MFTKIVGKECKTPGCEQMGLMKEPSAFVCEKCGLELAPIRKTDPVMMGVAALAGVLLMGGLGWGVRTYLMKRASTAISEVVSGGGSSGGSSGGSGATQPAATTLQYAIQSADDGRPRTVSADHVFRSGDRFRLVVKSPAASHYYVFYEDRRNEKMEILFPEGPSRAAGAGDTVAVPAGNDNWIKLDNNPGLERFIVIAANAAIDEFDFGASNTPKARFDAALEKVKAKYGLAEAKSGSDLDWTKVEAQGKGLLMARFNVQHQ